MASSSELLNKVVGLVNEAKVELQAQKTFLLTQVKEICLNRDSSLLPEVIPMVAEFQTDFNPNSRKFVTVFMRDVVRAHPEHVGLVVPVASYLMHDDSPHVKKMAVLLANTVYRPALQRLVDNGHAEGAQEDWSLLEGLRKLVLNTITSGPADISMVAVKFAESVVLACVGGRSLAYRASREDESVQRDLSRNHPFLLADTLDQAGHSLARQMAGWLGIGCSGGGGGPAKGVTGWGSGFGAQNYAALINALQRLATNRAALFGDIVPALASALDNVNGGGQVNGGGKKNAAAGSSGNVPDGLRDAASSLRSACLKLLKVAPGASKSVQRLASAAALASSDGEAKAAVDGNPALRGRIKLPTRARERPPSQKAPPVHTLALTAEDRRALADLAASASLGKMPKPPPGYRQRRTEGFPLPDLEALFGHVLCALGPEIATAKSQPAATGARGGSGKGSAGVKRARSPATDEGGGKRRSGDANGTVQSNGGRKAPGTGRSPMEVDGGDRDAEPDRKPGAVVKSELEGGGEAEAIDPVQAGLEAAKKAFSRVLDVWEGAATEGKRGLHQRVVARLGRMLVEAEATAVAQGVKASESELVVVEVVEFMTKDYKKRYQAALALLTDIYAADVAAANRPAAAASATRQGGKAKRVKKRGFELYDEALLGLLTTLSGSLEASWRQKLFTQTLLECPRVPPAALELVCSLCDMAAKPQDVQTGLVALKDLIFHKPATRNVCVPSVLHFTYHSDNDVRSKAVRLASNLLWPDAAFQPAVEAFAKQALGSVRLLEVREKKVEKKPEKVKPLPATPRKREAQEQDLVDFEGDDDEEEEEEAPVPVPPPVPVPLPVPAPGVRVILPWLKPPDTEAAARVRLSLYFALCVKSRPMLSGLLEAYVTAAPAAQAGVMAELPQLAKAAAKGFSEPGVVGLMAAAPGGSKALVLVMLDLLVPKETNKPSPELVAAIRRLRDTRLAAAAAVAVKNEEGEDVKVDKLNETAGVEYMVPTLGGLGREGVAKELPALLQADDNIVRAAFRRLTQPAREATYTPSELVVLLNRFDYTGAGVPIKRLTRALSLCLENKTVYNYPVLRSALDVMSRAPSPEAGGTKQLPLLLMRTVMVSVTTFPELKNFVATAVLVRLVQQQVWTQPLIWDGFLRCARMMAKESGATSFIAMVQLPDKKLKEALASPLMKGVKEPLRRYAQTLVKVDAGVRAVLGMDTGTRDIAAMK